ncbi:MAG: AAA family ATPase [Bacteroidia bacterium]
MSTKTSPFIYGSTVSKYGFTNREAELKKLKDNLLSGINTSIISPRRWGKSSLVEKAAQQIELQHKDVKIVMIDLFTISSEEEFLLVFAREVVKASSNKLDEWIKTAKSIFKQLVPKIQISSAEDNDFNLSFEWRDLKKHSSEILNLPEILAQKKKLKFIICIDEFQNIAQFSNFEAFEKKLRAHWQRHSKTTYCLYGSKRHMMTEIFNSPSRPFYRFGDIIMLPKIQKKKWVSYICEAFKKTGKQIGEAEAGMIAGLMQNHSWYIQQLGHFTWNKTDKKADKNTVLKALEELIYANTPFYQRDYEGLSGTQTNLLKAVANGQTKLMSVGTMTDFHLGTPRNISKNKLSLIKQDILEETEKGYEFLDPAFELWFRKTVMKTNVF